MRVACCVDSLVGLLSHNRVRRKKRCEQPEKSVVREYFGERHWGDYSLDTSVEYGMKLAAKTGKHFAWLTCTNRGASEVCEAALRILEVTQEELDWGYACDPTSKSRLRIVAKEGVLLRLTRNFDKSRGFVNGALAKVFEELDSGVIIAQLVESGNMVLIHPMEEKGMTFLPCCYGYATTIRRAQGASLDIGCLYFDQKKHFAGRGYAYVGVSRFRTREGCHLYGILRQSDFLPVGTDKEEDHWERGYDSLNESDSEYEGNRNVGGTFNEEESDPEYDIFNTAGNELKSVEYGALDADFAF